MKQYENNQLYEALKKQGAVPADPQEENGWDFEIGIKPYNKNIGVKSWAIVHIDYTYKPILKTVPIKKKGSILEKRGEYFFLEGVEFTRIIEKGVEDASFGDNVIWQFGKHLCRHIQPICKKNWKKGSGYLLIYRHTERDNFVKELSEEEVEAALKLSEQELCDKYLPPRMRRKSSVAAELAAELDLNFV